MELEDQAKVVASVWGPEFVQFLAALAVLPWYIRKKRSNSSYFPNRPWPNSQRSKEFNKCCPPNQGCGAGAARSRPFCAGAATMWRLRLRQTIVTDSDYLRLVPVPI